MSIAAYQPQILAAKAAGAGPARLLWRSGAWHRLAPLIQGWAALGVPMGLGLSGDEVDDVIAKVLVRAWTLAEVPDSPPAWCHVAARNMALDTLKVRQTVSLDTVEEMAAPDDRTEEELAYRREVGRLREALRRLPDPVRRVVVLHWLHGQRHDTVARTLGITVGASKMRAMRGLRLLRKIYEITPRGMLTERGVPVKGRGRPLHPLTWRTLPQHSGLTAVRPTARAAHAEAQLLGIA